MFDIYTKVTKDTSYQTHIYTLGIGNSICMLCFTNSGVTLTISQKKKKNLTNKNKLYSHSNYNFVGKEKSLAKKNVS